MKYQWVITIIAILINSALWAEDLSPVKVDGAKTVTTEQAKALFDEEVLFVDVRKTSDWDAGRVPGAVHLDIKKGKFNEQSLAEEITKHEKVVIYCNGSKCMRSSKGTKAAVSWGFSNVYYYRDGFPAWKLSGYPVE